MDFQKLIEMLGRKMPQRERVIPASIVRFEAVPARLMRLIDADSHTMPTVESRACGILFKHFRFEIQCNCAICQMNRAAEDAEDEG